MKTKIIFIFLLSFFLLLKASSIVSASTNVETFRVTSRGQREDWPVIYKNTICWLEDRGVYCSNTSKHNEYPFFGDGEPTNIYSLVGLDSRYLVFNTLSSETSFDVTIYDYKNKTYFPVTSQSGNQNAVDYDNQTILYVDEQTYPCGKLYAYRIPSKIHQLLADNICLPARISQDIVIWTEGNTIWGFKLNQNRKFKVTDEASSPADIYGNQILWITDNGNPCLVHLKNIITSNEKILYQGNKCDLTWPQLDKRYAVWGKSTEQHIAGVEGIDLFTGEVFTIQEQGPHQNGVISPQIEGNTVAWMAWRTGNGDIYGSVLGNNRPVFPTVPKPPKPPKIIISIPKFPR